MGESAVVVLQRVLLPQDDEMREVPRMCFRSSATPERADERMLPETSRWSFCFTHGEVERYAGDLRTSVPDPETSGAAPAHAHYDQAARCLVIPAGETADLSCYFNMISARKWLTLTAIQDIELYLDLEGPATIRVYAHCYDDFETDEEAKRFGTHTRTEPPSDAPVHTELLVSGRHASDGRSGVAIPLGRPDATLVGFSVSADGGGDVRLHGGFWSAHVERAAICDVDLCIVSTTFNREEFIQANIARVKRLVHEESLVEGSLIAGRLSMLVVDNGRTLDSDALSDDVVRVISNVNAGGSGGFARGMIEALAAGGPDAVLARKPTHLLLMDDDVVVAPESIRRTFTLLSLLKPGRRNSFVSGAMLRMESRDVQHESVAHIRRSGFARDGIGPHRLATVLDCAANEAGRPSHELEYAAWWYCCVPMTLVSEDSLPLPLFVRGDDMEFGVRHPVGVISLNGICVWHMGFGQKFNAAIEYYQTTRNQLILRACHERATDFIEPIGPLVSRLNEFVNCFAYGYVELLLDAIEDYLEGPSILEKPDGADVIRTKSMRNERFVPMAEALGPDIDVDFGKVMYGCDLASPKSVARRKFVTFTSNVQRRFRGLATDDTQFYPQDWEYNHELLFRQGHLITVDPVNYAVSVRDRDLQHFERVAIRRNAVLARYEREHEQVERQWREAFPRLTSLGFWRGYLDLA